jgi:hypothetical protein
LGDIPQVERLAILVVVYLITYLAVVVGWFRVTGPLQVCLSLTRDFLPGPLKATADCYLPAGPRVIHRQDSALQDALPTCHRTECV